jgi:hypothetical protein
VPVQKQACGVFWIGTPLVDWPDEHEPSDSHALSIAVA